MPRTAIPLQVDDLSPFAKTLRQSLATYDGVPSHVELLNFLAKAAGFQNFQHLRADAEAADRLRAAEDPGPRADLALVTKTARYFDDAGVLTSWPSRFAHQTLSQWVFWSRIPRGEVFSERQISDLIRDWHGFGDHAIIRRAMVDAKMIERKQNGREYRRIEQVPPPELAPLLAHLLARAG
ncbi:MAG: DUF2087 domain-containing protein [Devosia sp.]